MLRGNGLIFTPSLRDIAADADARAAPGTSTPAARRVDVPLFRAPGAALPAAVAVCVSFRVVLLADRQPLAAAEQRRGAVDSAFNQVVHFAATRFITHMRR